MSSDAWNRADQQCRAAMDFTVLEFIDISDKYRPQPIDPRARAFAPREGQEVDLKKIQVGQNTVDLEEIKHDVAFLASQDKEYIMNQLVSV